MSDHVIMSLWLISRFWYEIKIDLFKPFPLSFSCQRLELASLTQLLIGSASDSNPLLTMSKVQYQSRTFSFRCEKLLKNYADPFLNIEAGLTILIAAVSPVLLR